MVKKLSKVVKPKKEKVSKKVVAKPTEPTWISATDFAKLIPMSIPAVTKMFDDKLTEGVSYKRVGKNKLLIHVEEAKRELRETIKPNQAKSLALLKFIGLEQPAEDGKSAEQDEVSKLNQQQVREELARSELRLNLIEEKVQTGKYVDKAIVEKNLEAMGIEIRNSFSGFAARVTPQVRSAESDREAENIIHKAVEDIFTNLSSILERDVAANK